MDEEGSKSTWIAAVALCVAVLLVVATSFFDPRAWLLIRNTAALASGAATVAVPTGALLAFLLLRTDMPGRKLLLIVFCAMLFVPLYLQAAGWDAGFGKQGWY